MVKNETEITKPALFVSTVTKKSLVLSLNDEVTISLRKGCDEVTIDLLLRGEACEVTATTNVANKTEPGEVKLTKAGPNTITLQSENGKSINKVTIKRKDNSNGTIYLTKICCTQKPPQASLGPLSTAPGLP